MTLKIVEFFPPATKVKSAMQFTDEKQLKDLQRWKIIEGWVVKYFPSENRTPTLCGGVTASGRKIKLKSVIKNPLCCRQKTSE
jgi:hypothetical protein